MSGDDADKGIERAMGGVQADVKRLLRGQENSDRESATYRQQISSTLNEINNKVDPMRQQIDSHTMTLQAHEAAIKSLSNQRDDLMKTAKIGKRIIHGIWIAGIAMWLLFSGDFRGFLKLFH